MKGMKLHNHKAFRLILKNPIQSILNLIQTLLPSLLQR
jgi:hypothetical protein